MNQRLPILVLGLGLLLTGCASQPGPVHLDADNRPQVRLPDGEIDLARALAMGMARSNGWDIVAAEPRRLLLERRLPPDSPQAAALSAGAGSDDAARIQVQADLSQAGSDVLVALSAFAVAGAGTEEERRIDYTDDYQDALLLSLDRLSGAWIQNRGKIASQIPLPPQGEVALAAETEGPASGAERWAEETAVAIDGSDAAPDSAQEAEAAAPPGGDRAASAPGSGAAGGPAAAAGDSGAPMPQPIAPSEPPLTVAQNEMLVLDAGARKGLWAYYAEDEARSRGCELGERGAVLLQQADTFELHEVECRGGPNMLLRCQGGVCSDMR